MLQTCLVWAGSSFWSHFTILCWALRAREGIYCMTRKVHNWNQLGEQHEGLRMVWKGLCASCSKTSAPARGEILNRAPSVLSSDLSAPITSCLFHKELKGSFTLEKGLLSFMSPAIAVMGEIQGGLFLLSHSRLGSPTWWTLIPAPASNDK